MNEKENKNLITSAYFLQTTARRAPYACFLWILSFILVSPILDRFFFYIDDDFIDEFIDDFIDDFLLLLIFLFIILTILTLFILMLLLFHLFLHLLIQLLHPHLLLYLLHHRFTTNVNFSARSRSDLSFPTMQYSAPIRTPSGGRRRPWFIFSENPLIYLTWFYLKYVILYSIPLHPATLLTATFHFSTFTLIKIWFHYPLYFYISQ